MKWDAGNDGGKGLHSNRGLACVARNDFLEGRSESMQTRHMRHLLSLAKIQTPA
jgi:hypothetical protein